MSCKKLYKGGYSMSFGDTGGNAANDLFYNKNGKAIEGFLGDENKCEILFILREPNSNGKEPDNFWLKNALNGDCIINEDATDKEKSQAKRSATKYINVLGKLYNVINATETNREDMITNLKNCCYINLHPYFGKSAATNTYKQMLKEFNDYKKSKNEKFKNAQNRWEIIDMLIEKYGCKHIVTLMDIFSAIRPEIIIDKKLICGYKRFRIGMYKTAEVYEFYHPAYCISNEKLKNILYR